jgi:uncharacterized membrane protein YeiH
MFELIEYIGIIAFGVSGFLVAIRHNLDLLGVFISTFLTALGGGLLRDVLIDKTPYSFTHNQPALILLALIAFMILFRPYKKSNIEQSSIFILSDSLGLSSFSISGAMLAIKSGFNLTGILAVSFISAVGGGILRDVIINEVPFIFKTGFYGTVTLLIGIVIYILYLFNFINFYTLIAVLIFGTITRVIAYYKAWNLPKI